MRMVNNSDNAISESETEGSPSYHYDTKTDLPPKIVRTVKNTVSRIVRSGKRLPLNEVKSVIRNTVKNVVRRDPSLQGLKQQKGGNKKVRFAS
jgi:hypothetical protein